MSRRYEFWLRQGGTAIQLPLPPERVRVANTSRNATFDVDQLGQITILRSPNLKEFSFRTKFPRFFFLGCQYRDLPDPKEAWLLLDRMKNSLRPVRFIVTNTPINLEVSIQTLTGEEQGGDVEDIYFNITLREFRTGAARQVQVVNNQATLNNETPRQDNRARSPIYSVIEGDTLWQIAKKELGDGARWPEIATLNNISPKYLIFPDQVLQLPTT